MSNCLLRIIWSVYGYVRYLHIDGFLLFVYICKISFKGITLPRFVPVPRPNLDFHPQMTCYFVLKDLRRQVVIGFDIGKMVDQY